MVEQGEDAVPSVALHSPAVGGALEGGGGILCGSLWEAALLRDTSGDAVAKLRWKMACGLALELGILSRVRTRPFTHQGKLTHQSEPLVPKLSVPSPSWVLVSLGLRTSGADSPTPPAPPPHWAAPSSEVSWPGFCRDSAFTRQPCND